MYWPSRCGAGAKQMKNWLSALLTSEERAIETVPRTCFTAENSASSRLPEPPVPVPVGSPPCAMKFGITRWNGVPS